MKIEGSESASGSESGSISQSHGAAEPDPDPHQKVMDPHQNVMDQQVQQHSFSETWASLQKMCKNSYSKLLNVTS